MANPFTGFLSLAGAFEAVVPKLVAVGLAAYENKDDLAKQATRLTADLKKAATDFSHVDLASGSGDLGDAWKAGVAIFADVGLSYEAVSDVVSGIGGAPAASTLDTIEAEARAVAKKLGLPV